MDGTGADEGRGVPDGSRPPVQSVPSVPVAPSLPRVALWTRVGCHLCDEARAVVADVCSRTGDRWAEFDVDGDELRRREWTDKIPVVTVDGTVVDFWRVDPVRLRDRLTGRRRRWRGGRGQGS